MSVILQFHSKSKKSPPPFSPTALQDLSNFGLFDVEYGGATFPTVEHAYQALKYSCTEKPELVNSVQIEFRDRDPVDVKKAGSKATMKKLGVTLDVECWDGHKDGIMETLIKSKIDRHPEIRQTLEIAAKNNIMLVHFSRSDMYWGAHVSENGKSIKRGENNLGKIYMSYYPDVLSSGSSSSTSYSSSSSSPKYVAPPVRYMAPPAKPLVVKHITSPTNPPPVRQMTPPPVRQMTPPPMQVVSPPTIPPPKRNMTIDENVEEMLTEFPNEPLDKLREYAKKGYVLYKTEQGSYITKFDYPDNQKQKKTASPKTIKVPICPETKILNPKTRRCVNRTSKLGKEILAATRSPQNQSPKMAYQSPNQSPKMAYQSPKMALASPNQSPKMALKKAPTLKKDPICPETKILNPKTRRCVNRTSKLGKEILSKM